METFGLCQQPQRDLRPFDDGISAAGGGIQNFF